MSNRALTNIVPHLPSNTQSSTTTIRPRYIDLVHLIHSMRIRHILRTLYTFGATTSALRSSSTHLRGTTRHLQLGHNTNNHHSNYTSGILKSMPSIPFLSSFFSTSTPASEKMSYPDQRSNDEWRTVLNKGKPSAPTPFSPLLPQPTEQ